jgi:hypothetical protein
MPLKIMSRWVRSACVALLASGFFAASAFGAGNQLLVTAANSIGNSVYDLTESPNSPLIGAAAAINTDGARHGRFDSVVWLNNTAKGSLDLLVADGLNRQILRYPGPNYGTASVVYTWPNSSHTAPEPNALSVDGAGNLYVVTTSGDTTPSLWVLPINSAGAYGAAVLVDDRFGGVHTLLIADTVVASTTTALWNTGDLLVLVGDSFDPRVLVYSSIAIKRVIANPTAPLAGPTSTAISFETFLRERAVPTGMDQWPVDATHGESLLFSTTDGRILRYDTKARAFVTNVASGLGSGLQKLKAGLYANVPYAFVAQVLPHNAGKILQFQPPPASGPNPPVAAISAGVNGPMGLAVAQTDTTAAANCVAPNTCNLLSSGISISIAAPAGDTLSGTVITQSCIVQSDPRVSYPGGTWTCNGAQTLDVSNYCPGFPSTILPGTLCGHAGSSGAGLAVIKGTADGIDPFDNDAFIYTLADITVLLPGPNDLACSPLGALAWAPRSDLAGIEGTIFEDAISPFFIELTGFCDRSGQVNRGNSMYALGVAVNTAPAAMPTGLPGYVTTKYTNLSATIADANIATATAATLQSCVSTSQGDFNSGVAGAANGFACAVYQAVQCDDIVRGNLGSFSSNLTPTGGNPNPAGEIDGRLANLFLTINTRVAGNPPNPNWPAADVPACVDLSAPASVPAGSSGTLNWTAYGVPAASQCALSSSDGHFNNTAEPASGSVSTGTLNGAGSSITYDLSCPGAGAGTGLATASIAVTAVPPTVTIQAAPATIDLTGSSTLTWSTTNANSCTASGGWNGSKATSGSLLVSPSVTTTYILGCTGPGGGGTVSNSATVTVSPQPTVNFMASPMSIAYGASSILSWTSTNATSCSASDGWSGTEPASSSGVPVSPTVTTSYALTCYGPGGAYSQTIFVQVTVAPPPANINSFTASAATTGVGNQLTLNWSTTSAASCTVSASDGNYTTAQAVATSGPVLTGAFTRAATYSATLKCLPTGANSTATLTVNVLAPVPLNNPGGLAFASNGNLYVANEGQIVSEGNPQVNGQVLVYAPNTPGSNGQLIQQPQLTIGSPLQNPVAVAFDTLGNLYVADAGLNQILVFNSAGVQQSGATITICPDCAIPQVTGVTVDNLGGVYASVNNNAPLIQVFAYTSPLQNPQNVAYWFTDSSGDAWNSITSINFDGRYVWAGIQTTHGPELAAYTPAALNGSTNPQLSNRITTGVSTAAGIAFDPRGATQGNVLVADAQWQSSETSPITIYSAANSYSSITPNFIDGANPALNTPAGIAIDSSGNVYVADSNSNAIDVYTAAALTYEYSPEPAVSLSAKVGGVTIAQGTAETPGTSVTYSWSASGVPAGGSCTLSDNLGTTPIPGLPLSGSQVITIPLSVTGPYVVFVSCSYNSVPFTPTPGFTINPPNVVITATANGVPIVAGAAAPDYALLEFQWVANGLPAASTCTWSVPGIGSVPGLPLTYGWGFNLFSTPFTFTITCGNGTYSAMASFAVGGAPGVAVYAQVSGNYQYFSPISETPGTSVTFFWEAGNMQPASTCAYADNQDSTSGSNLPLSSSLTQTYPGGTYKFTVTCGPSGGPFVSQTYEIDQSP